MGGSIVFWAPPPPIPPFYNQKATDLLLHSHRTSILLTEFNVSEIDKNDFFDRNLVTIFWKTQRATKCYRRF